MRETQFDISLIINCHREKSLLLPTIHSAARSRLYAEKKGLKLQTLIVLDYGDPETEDLIKRLQSQETYKIDRIYEVQFGSLGEARNFGVQQAQGDFVAFLDGDDLFSENWLYEAFRLAKQDPKYIIHPEVNIFFGQDPHWWRHTDQTDPSFAAINFLHFNYWTALSFARKETYLKIPYHPYKPSSGFGYEDWHWNTRTVALEYVHRVAKDTAHFIRKKSNDSSLLLEANRNNCLIPRSELFEPKTLERIDLLPRDNIQDNSSPGRLLVFCYSFFRRIILAFFPTGFKNFIKKCVSKKESAGKLLIPMMYRSEIKEFASLDRNFFPVSEFLASNEYRHYAPGNEFFGRLYIDLSLKNITPDFKNLFILSSEFDIQSQLDCIRNKFKLQQYVDDSLFIMIDENKKLSSSLTVDGFSIYSMGCKNVLRSPFDDVLSVLLARYILQRMPKNVFLIPSPVSSLLLKKYLNCLHQISDFHICVLQLPTDEGQGLYKIDIQSSLIKSIYCSNRETQHYLSKNVGILESKLR